MVRYAIIDVSPRYSRIEVISLMRRSPGGWLVRSRSMTNRR
jgi:hypothetical protein